MKEVYQEIEKSETTLVFVNTRAQAETSYQELWKLNRKIQAKYYWQSVLNSKDSDKELKIKISKKLLEGLDES